MPTHIGDWIGVCLSGGRYTISAKLGEGGMGAVYRARDANLDTDVVIKVPHPQMLRDREFASRFAREIRSLVQLSHPHVVKILDVGQYDELPFAVMQYLPGRSLEDRRSDESPGKPLPMPPHQIIEWLEDVADALDFIHSQNYVHRDIKPGNILFDAHGNVFLSDFGVAKATASDEDTPGASKLTGTGMVLGTPDYMAPEVVLGKPYDGRADQYALAVMLFELICGRLPFVGPNPTAVLVAHSTQPAPEIRQIRPEVSAAVAAVVQKGLAKEPADRYPTCKALAVAFRRAVGQAHAGAVETVVRRHCPVCRQVLRVAEKAAGQRVPCPGCQSVLCISLNREEITVAGPGGAVSSGISSAVTHEKTTAAVQSPSVATAQPLPLPSPLAASARKRWILAAGAGGGILVLTAVALATLMVARRADRSISESTVAAGVPVVLTVPTEKVPASESSAKPNGDESEKNGPKERESGGNQEAEANPGATGTAILVDPPSPGPPVPVKSEHPSPPADVQLVIARKLNEQHGVKLAEVSADKNAMNLLAGRFCQLASAGGQAADECFVLWRLAGELYESAGGLQQAEETRRRLAAEFEGVEESLQESLLPQLRLRPPGEDSQWRIASQLEERYQVSQAGTPEEKQALAVRIFKDAHRPGDEEFVALRLALELFDEAERSEDVKTLGDQISMNYEVNTASLGERLLPRLVAARPAPADPLTGTLVDATKMIMNGDLKGGRVKLTEAGKTSGEDVRPDFLLGLLENFELSLIAAEECFRKCTKAKDQETARRAWNNLALVYLRQKKLKKTVDAFENAMELGESSEEIVQNLGKLYALKATTTTSNFWDPATKRSLDKLCQKTNASAVFDATIGWQLMPLLAADGEPLGGVDRKLFEDPRCLFCNGLCRIPCTQCGGSGTVTQQRAQTMAVDPVTGRKLGRSVKVAAACPACRGSGVILCPFCDRGLEKGLARTAEQKPEESPGQPTAIPPGQGQTGTVPASQPGMLPTAQPGGRPSIQPGTPSFPQTPRR